MRLVCFPLGHSGEGHQTMTRSTPSTDACRSAKWAPLLIRAGQLASYVRNAFGVIDQNLAVGFYLLCESCQVFLQRFQAADEYQTPVPNKAAMITHPGKILVVNQSIIFIVLLVCCYGGFSKFQRNRQAAVCPRRCARGH